MSSFATLREGYKNLIVSCIIHHDNLISTETKCLRHHLPPPSLFYLPVIRSIVWGAFGLNSMHCDSQNENLVLYAH